MLMLKNRSLFLWMFFYCYLNGFRSILILNHVTKNKAAVLLPGESIPITLISVLWQLKQFYDNDDDNKLQGYKYEWNL